MLLFSFIHLFLFSFTYFITCHVTSQQILYKSLETPTISTTLVPSIQTSKKDIRDVSQVLVDSKNSTAPSDILQSQINSTDFKASSNETLSNSKFSTFYSDEFKNNILLDQEKNIISTISKKLYGPNQEKNAEKYVDTCFLTSNISNKMSHLISCYEQFLSRLKPLSLNHTSTATGNTSINKRSITRIKKLVSSQQKIPLEKNENPTTPIFSSISTPNTASSAPNTSNIPDSSIVQFENSPVNIKAPNNSTFDLSDEEIEKKCVYSFSDSEAKNLNAMYLELFYSFKKMKSSKGMCLGENFGMCSGNDLDNSSNPDVLELEKSPPLDSQSNIQNSNNLNQTQGADTKAPKISPQVTPASNEKIKQDAFKKLEDESQTKFTSGKQISYEDGLKIKVWMDTIRESLGNTNVDPAVQAQPQIVADMKKAEHL
ncbi:hypothetical protein AYI69_g4407 [Smittium culicis]|uniref:Uncharacterized protein n=1 Tax=Smittium culicis TaxID=133412 RepID=A0A1R1YDX6_9FUNG|nr:hypothetical protein AYI69_g7704 [Smittium culicis]OMJ25093.1 hypothetical protein AYI69_g4407 [Smittium culicis]